MKYVIEFMQAALMALLVGGPVFYYLLFMMK